MDQVRWGVLSTAAIGVNKVIPAIDRAENCKVVAIASRDADRAARAAADLGLPTSYGSYEKLLEADDVDAVYIPLPNDLHAEWTMKAAAAGKHVLCEKPLARSAAEAEEMARACDAAGVVLGEAFMYRHHQSWVEAVRLVRGGEIGELQAVQSFFSFYNDDPTDIRNRVENAGGAVMDIGCYCIHLSRSLFDGEPSHVQASVRRDPQMGIDTLASAVLSFPGGGQATFTCSTRAEPYQRVHIMGSRGRIEIEIPFNIPTDRATRILVTAGGEPPVAPDTRVVSLPAEDAYETQARLFAQELLGRGRAPVSVDDAIANMRVIDAVLAAG